MNKNLQFFNILYYSLMLGNVSANFLAIFNLYKWIRRWIDAYWRIRPWFESISPIVHVQVKYLK